MQLIEAARRPILRIDARTKFALRGGNIIIDVPALLAGSNNLCADGIAFGAKQADKNIHKIYCRIPYHALAGLDSIFKSQRWLCSAIFFSREVGETYAPDFNGRYPADENHFRQRVHAFL